MSEVLTRIGRYEIVDLVGEGGMGRVYRARDTELDRSVAIKILSLATDPELLRRFEQEARATAALSHPGILAVYDVGMHDGMPYLVTELLEGSTLRARLDAERLTVATALRYAIQVAEALAAAHGKGIIHRDLKPDNLFITAGDRIKILDFGLAKLNAMAAVDRTRLDVTGTLPNTILGTPAYMPPEQARGGAADHRADIFSFGCVLYEMLEGRRAFEGSTAADVISSILKDAPRSVVGSADRILPPALDGIVQRCLAKDPNDRFQSASDLAFALQSVAHGSGIQHVAGPGAGRGWRHVLSRRAASLAGAAAAGALVAFLLLSTRRSEVQPVIEFLVPPPSTEQSFAPMPLPGLLPTAPQVGLSPDGRLLAFVTSDADGKRRLWIRALQTSRPRPVDGTEGATSWPIWSPDSRHVVIAVGRALLKADIVNNTVERLASLPDEAPGQPFVTGSWSEDGTILFSIGGSTGIYRLAASGGAPRIVTQMDEARRDQYHSWPQLLPGGRVLLFVRTDNPDTTGMYSASLESGQLTQVFASASRAIYANGHLLWMIDDRLVAQPFDASSLALTGEPVTIAPSVFLGAGRTAGFWASNTGTLVYAAGDTRERQFRWLSRSGSALDTVGPPGLYVTFDVSSDLSKLVVEISKDTSARFSTLALFEMTRGVLSPLTLGDQNDTDPRFGPDDDVLFAHNSRDSPGLMRIDLEGRQQSLMFPRGKLPVLWLEDWAPDGSSAVYRSGASADAWQLLGRGSEPQRLTEAKTAIEQVQLSPDRRWIAYNTAESDRSEVFVSAVPLGGERRQVSVEGGVQPTWRADGRELYYLGLDGGLYSVAISTAGTTLSVSAPQLLFRTSLPVISAVVEQYRPSGDGQRFLFCMPLTSVRHEPLRMIVNWPAKLAPAD